MAGLLGGGKKTISNAENRVGALQIQQSSQGVPIPLVWGTTRIAPNLLWYGDFTAIPQTTSQRTGKGGGSRATNTTYTYTVAVVLGLCEGTVQEPDFCGIVWANKDITDATALGLTQFDGNYSTQAPWSYLTTNHANEALNYRGQAYVAASAFDLGDSPSLPNLNFEVTGFGENAGGDESPAFVLTGLLTEIDFGAGWPEAQLGNLSAWTTYCAEANIAISPAYTAQQPAAELVTELALIGNAAPVWSEGLLKMIPFADSNVGSFVPDVTVQYALTYDDFIAEPGNPPIKVTRKRQADAYNQVQVECLDRANGYNSYVAEAKDQSSIDLYGLRPMQMISAHAICDANVARTVAQTVLQRAQYVRNTYEFTLGWRYARLEPMDIVSITDPLLGLSALPVRITAIEEDANGLLSITAEDMTTGVSTPGSYATQASSGNAPNVGADPGDANTPVIFQPPLAMTGNAPQVWIGAAGGANWGGAQVWVSLNNSSYEQAGIITGPATYGALTANFPAASDPDTLNTLAANLAISGGELSDVSQSSADALASLTYVGGNGVVEIIGYSNVTLTAPYNYNLSTYIRRGLEGSTAIAHNTGAQIMRLDEAVARINLPSSVFGTTVFVKLLSYNTVGAAVQSLADVDPYSFNVATPSYSNTSSVDASTLSITLAEGVFGIVEHNISYYGASVEGAPLTQKVLHRQYTANGALAQSSSNIGTWITAVDTDGSGVIYAAGYDSNASTPLIDTSRVLRFVGSNLAAPTANYTLAAGANSTWIAAMAFGGSKVYALETNPERVVQLHATTLAAEGNVVTAANLPTNTIYGVMRHDGNGSLYVAADNSYANAPQLTKWATAGNTATWNIATASGPSDMLVVDDRVFVAGTSQIKVHNATSGALVATVTCSAPGTARGMTLAETTGYVAAVNAAERKPLLLDKVAGTLIRYVDVAADYMGGGDESLLIVNASPGGSYLHYEGYAYSLVGLTSVGLELPTSLFTNTGLVVTSAGNLTANLATQNAALFFAGPATGNAAAPTFRAIAATDFNAGVDASNVTFLRGDMTWGTASGGNATQNASQVYAGPASGNAAAPAFRALVGGDMPRLTINTQTANYTLALADANVAWIDFNSSSNLVCTVPHSANVAFANGTSVIVNRRGSGTLTISAAANVTVANSSSNTLRAQNSTAGLVMRAPDQWVLFGDVT